MIDRITILEIKVERLNEPQRARAADELKALRETLPPEAAEPLVVDLSSLLRAVNIALWEVEEQLRDFERESSFGIDFIECARSVYLNNDNRYRLKRQINDLLGSSLLEQKSYV